MKLSSWEEDYQDSLAARGLKRLSRAPQFRPMKPKMKYRCEERRRAPETWGKNDTDKRTRWRTAAAEGAGKKKKKDQNAHRRVSYSLKKCNGGIEEMLGKCRSLRGGRRFKKKRGPLRSD